MPRYFIEVVHRAEDCAEVIGAMREHDPAFLDDAWMGCSDGDHAGWAFVDADTEEQARGRLPVGVRAHARVVPVEELAGEAARTASAAEEPHVDMYPEAHPAV